MIGRVGCLGGLSRGGGGLVGGLLRRKSFCFLCFGRYFEEKSMVDEDVGGEVEIAFNILQDFEKYPSCKLDALRVRCERRMNLLCGGRGGVGAARMWI